MVVLVVLVVLVAIVVLVVRIGSIVTLTLRVVGRLLPVGAAVTEVASFHHLSRDHSSQKQVNKND